MAYTIGIRLVYRASDIRASVALTIWPESWHTGLSSTVTIAPFYGQCRFEVCALQFKLQDYFLLTFHYESVLLRPNDDDKVRRSTMPAFSNGSYHHFCSLLMQMQYMGETYHTSIAYANFWFDVTHSKDLFQPWTQLVHEHLRRVPLDTKVSFLGSLPSTLRDHLASWASICRPIYPRTRLNRRNEPDRSTSVETVRTKRNETISVWQIDEWLATGPSAVLGIVIEYNILPSIPLTYD